MTSLVPTTILQLNKNCYYHIFQLLPMIDWCNLRYTCTKLRIASDCCFKRQGKSFELKPQIILGENYDVMRVEHVIRLILSFGKFMRKLSLNRKYFYDHEEPVNLLPYLNEHCVALKDLKLVKIDVDPATIVTCDHLFANLRQLVVDQWNQEESLTCCLAHCTSLKELEVIRLKGFKGSCLADSRLKCLESFTMIYCSGFDYDCVKEFFVHHSQLKQVKFFDPEFPTGDVMLDIAEALPDLMELSVKCVFSFKPMEAVMKMRSLTKFEIDLDQIAVDLVGDLMTGLAKQNNIEELLLAFPKQKKLPEHPRELPEHPIELPEHQRDLPEHQIELPEHLRELPEHPRKWPKNPKKPISHLKKLIPHLCSMKTLKILKLVAATKHLNAVTCTQLAIELPGLTEVHIIECQYITFLEIEEFVIHLADLHTIVFNRFGAKASFTADTFTALVESRIGRLSDAILSIFLNGDDLADIQNEFQQSGRTQLLTENADVIKLLPLNELETRTVFEYGSGFLGRSDDDEDDDDESLYGRDDDIK